MALRVAAAKQAALSTEGVHHGITQQRIRKDQAVIMALRLILGNSGSGKSYQLYQHIIAESQQNPQTEYLVIVPEQFTMQTQKDLVTMHPNKGIMNIDVLSFARLAHRIFEEVGQSHRAVLDDEGKNLILRKIAGAYEKDLKVLGGNLKKQGYISEVKSVISEFAQYGVDGTDLEDLIGGMKENSYLAWKLTDIQILSEGFYRYLSDKYITKEELLYVLRQVAGKSEILKDAVIALDGFTGFTPVQETLIGELLQICKDVWVTVTGDEREDLFVYEHPYQLFGLSKQMVTGLIRTAREAKVKIEGPLCLYQKPVYRYRNNPELAFLEEELFRYSRKTWQGDSDRVRILSARNPKEEAVYVAETIRRLVRTKGYRYREIAVIAPDLSLYAEEFEHACERYEIPVFTDHKRSILLNSFVEYVRSLLSMAEKNYSYDSVFRYLRSGHAGFTMEEVDLMENYVLALGIRGYKKWQEKWIRRTESVQEEELEVLNHLRVRLVEQLDPLMFILKKRKKSVLDITQAVCEFLEKEKLQEQLVAMEEMFQDRGDVALAKEYAQIYRIVLELFDKFVELLGDETVSLKEYCELLDAGLTEAKVGVIPPSIDQVTIGDMQRSRLKEIQVLFLVGVNDTLIPGTNGSMGLLTEQDREVLKEKKLHLSPGAREQNFIQKFYLYMNLTKPSEALYLSYSKSASDGTALRPAYLIWDLKRLFPKLEVEEAAKRRMERREFSEQTGLEEVLDGLRKRQTGLEESWKELYTWYYSNPKWAAQVERLVETAFYRKDPQWIRDVTAKVLYGENAQLSATRMERFAACAYAHFLAYGLKLKEREEYRFEAMDLGNIVHKALELFSNKVIKEGLTWEELEEEKQRELVEECVQESIACYENTILYSSARNEYMIFRIRKLLERTIWALTKQLEKGNFRISASELKFGGGKIDRVDTCESGEKLYVKVIDYKTGSKAFDITAMYHGLQMQLMIYLGAAMEYEKRRHPEKELHPAGVFYYQVKDPLVEKGDSLLKELRPDGLVSDVEDVLKGMDRQLEGESEVIPVKRNKDQSLAKSSKAVSEEDFDVMLRYVRGLAEQMQERIQRGETGIYPYLLGQKSGCDYCKYQEICGFDLAFEGCEYHRMKSWKKDEVLEQMRKELES